MSQPNRLSYEGGPNSTSLQDLNEHLDDIFNNYVSDHKSNSNDTIDSSTYQAQPAIAQRSRRLIPDEALDRFNSENVLPVHISSRLSSLKRDNDSITQSAPQTPNSGSSFDFHPHTRPLAMSNPSLNILDTPTIEHELKDLISPSAVLDKSVEALRSLSLEDESKLEKPYLAAESKENKEWIEKGAATKTVGDSASGVKVIRRSVTDFEFGKQLGEGSYSTVVLATDKITSTKYAIKILDKRHIIKEKKVKYVNIEKHALNRLSNRLGVVTLYFTFQDKDSLYFVLDYASKGELLSLIKTYNTLNEECVRYFGAQILDAIKFMHDNGVIHRDIKPENILLDDKMRILITDFGTARLLEKKNEDDENYPVDIRAKSFVGTAEYVSPELLESKYCGKPGDIWAFGCILYQMIAGKPPFKAANEYLTFQKITKLQYAFSAGFPLVMRDLIKQILVLQPSRRATIPTIQSHYFFQSVDFDDFDQIWNTEVPELGPYKMSAKSMMKMPDMPKSSSVKNLSLKRSQPKKDASTVKRVVSEPANNGNKADQAPVNPAMAAAYVLNKKENGAEDDDESISDITDTTIDDNSIHKIASRKSDNTTPAASRVPSVSAASDYIPGTNILRPTINSRQSYSRSSSKMKQPKPKSKSKILEVSPITPLEIAWGKYLKHPDERILKIGAVIASKMTTESFEKKHRGLIHDSPLGFQNRNRSNTSFLSQVVSGNGSSLRSGNLGQEDGDEDDDESKAIIDYFVIEEIPSSPVSESNSNSKMLSKLFKKLGISNKDKTLSSEPVSQHPLEKPRTCTMLITSHGRALIFFRNDPEANYRLISEVRLNHSFIHFKEVVSNAGRLLKMIPTTGIFAIQSTISTFTFEVEKYDVNGWTESLAKSQTNQYERLASEKAERSNPKQSTSSPKLLESPHFQSSNSQQCYTSSPTSSPTDRIKKTSDTKSPAQSAHRERESLLSSRINHRSVKRKPPPPIKSSTGGVDMSTGLSGGGESGMLHAAQLAVSNNSNYPTTDNRRSSFTKEERSSGAVSSPKVRPSINSSNGNHPKVITSMNSKFLARSQRKK